MDGTHIYMYTIVTRAAQGPHCGEFGLNLIYCHYRHVWHMPLKVRVCLASYFVPLRHKLKFY